MIITRKYLMYRFVILSCSLGVCLGGSFSPLDKGLLESRPDFPNGRIVGGSDAHISEVPWQLSLELEETGRQFCGAAIISQYYVVSTAHCLENFSSEDVVIRTGSSVRGEGGWVYKAKRFISHPKYNATTVDYDISVIELAGAILLNDYSLPIQVTDEEPQAGQYIRVSGWGDLLEGSKNGSDQLQSVTVPIVDRATCVEEYGTEFTVTERMICAGARDKDSCQGDSGGPVELVGSGILVGVASWGLGCGREGYPGVYTNIADPEIREFIQENTDI